MTEKIYSPEVIDDTLFPQQQITVDAEGSSGSTKDVSKPQAIKDDNFPSKVVAREVMGVALNTKARKILQEFQFTEMGALQIGKYENGISGDLRFTPAGFVGRSTTGDTTIAFDVETGSAIFAGELRAGTVVAGDVIVGNNTWIISGDPDFPRIVLYNNGIPEIVIGEV